jgi:hypothetical protein
MIEIFCASMAAILFAMIMGLVGLMFLAALRGWFFADMPRR